MIADKSQLLAAARSLSVDDRRELIDALMETLPEQEGIRDAWIAECRRRLEDFDSGRVEGIPLIDVFPELGNRDAC